MRRRRTRQAWRELIAGFADSGLTVDAYCAGKRIPASCFYRWRALFAEERSHRPALAKTSPVKISAVPAVMAPSLPPPFVDLGLLAAAQSRVELRLDLGGGVTLHVARS